METDIVPFSSSYNMQPAFYDQDAQILGLFAARQICPFLGTSWWEVGPSWWGRWQGSSWGDWSPSTLGRRRVGFTPDMESVWMKGHHTHG